MQFKKEYGSRFVSGLVLTLFGLITYVAFSPTFLMVIGLVLFGFGAYLLFTCAR